MITKIQIFQFFDILKIGKYIAQNNLYSSEKQSDNKQYDFQNNIQQNKD